MPRPAKPEHQKLALQAVRISPIAKDLLSSLPTKEKKEVIAEMRKAVENIIIAMTSKELQAARTK